MTSVQVVGSKPLYSIGQRSASLSAGSRAVSRIETPVAARVVQEGPSGEDGQALHLARVDRMVAPRVGEDQPALEVGEGSRDEGRARPPGDEFDPRELVVDTAREAPRELLLVLGE